MLKSREYYIETATYMIDQALKVASVFGLNIRVIPSTYNGKIIRWDFLDGVPSFENGEEGEDVVPPRILH